MSGVLVDEEIKRWTARRKSAPVQDIIRDRCITAHFLHEEALLRPSGTPA